VIGRTATGRVNLEVKVGARAGGRYCPSPHLGVPLSTVLATWTVTPLCGRREFCCHQSWMISNGMPSRRCAIRITDAALSGLPRSACRTLLAMSSPCACDPSAKTESRSEAPLRWLKIQVVVVGGANLSCSPPKLAVRPSSDHRYPDRMSQHQRLLGRMK